MRRLENYVRKYGPDFGPILYHTLQSQAAHAGVSARLRRKLDALSGKPAAARKPAASADDTLPLFRLSEHAHRGESETPVEAELVEAGV